MIMTRSTKKKILKRVCMGIKTDKSKKQISKMKKNNLKRCRKELYSRSHRIKYKKALTDYEE
jgi:hypothetical protein